MSMGITALAQDREGFWSDRTWPLSVRRQRFVNVGPKEGLPIGPDSHLWADPRESLDQFLPGLFRVRTPRSAASG